MSANSMDKFHVRLICFMWDGKVVGQKKVFFSQNLMGLTFVRTSLTRVIKI